MKSSKSRFERVAWRGWDVQKVEDPDDLGAPLPNDQDDYKYVVDTAIGDYGRFLRLGALINQRMEVFAKAVRAALKGMTDSNDSRFDTLSREIGQIQRRLDSTEHTYEQLRGMDQKLRMIDSMDNRLVRLEKIIENMKITISKSANSPRERAAQEQLPPSPHRNERNYGCARALRSSMSVPAGVVWVMMMMGVLVVVDIVTRFIG